MNGKQSKTAKIYMLISFLPFLFVISGNVHAGPYNIAPQAKVSASAGVESAGSVIDGIIGVDSVGEWSSRSAVHVWGGYARPWIQLTWDKPQSVNRVILFDRPSLESHCAAGDLLFDDGSRIHVSAIPNDGKARVVDFPARRTQWIRFQVTDADGPNTGLSEMEVYPSPEDYVDYVSKVDPYIETEQCRYFYFATGSLPFGMISSAPLTRNKNQYGGGYNYNSTEILGFPQLHCWMMAGVNFMPTTGDINLKSGEKGWKSKFSHDGEIVQPGYHRVFLDDHKIWVEQTCTDRVGFYRLRYTKDTRSNLLVNLGGYLANVTMTDAQMTKVSDTEIEGSFNTTGRQWGGPDNARIFFVMRVDKPFETLNAWNGEEILNNIEQFQGSKDSWTKIPNQRSYHDAPSAGVAAVYQVKRGDVIQVKFAVSCTNIENARKNMDTECDHWDFNKVLADARQEWNRWLGRIDVEGGTEGQQIKFYTDLWHVLLGRHKLDDSSGDYPDYTHNKREGRPAFTVNTTLKVRALPKDASGKVKHHIYNSDAFWLTQWNLNLLWGLGWPEVLDDFAACMVQYAENGGLLPRGPNMGAYSFIMTGCPVTNLITCAYQKGMLTKVSHEKAWQAMDRNHKPGGMMSYEMYGTPNEKALDFYIKNGYWPGNAGITIEMAFQDWALSQMAAKMGKKKDAAYYLQRSKGWEKLHHPGLKLIMPKDAEGKWVHETPTNGTGWVEGNSWHGTWSVSHAIPRLAELMGGFDTLCDHLNYAFEKGMENNFTGSYVNYSNQPGCSSAHVFNFAGKPWLTQYWVRKVQEHTFGATTTDHGYGGGDEDQGQMGALSALMSIGLFSVQGTCAQRPAYEITSPIFDKITIHLNPAYYKGKTFEIITYNNSKENCYIQRAAFNGQPHRSLQIDHDELAKGGVLELWLGDQPNKADNAVVPIKWSRFSAHYPNDANAKLQKTVAQNAVKYALNVWYAKRFGSQPAGEYYLDVLLGPGSVEDKVRGSGSQAMGIATLIKLGLYDARYTGVSKQAALDVCTKIIRSIAYRHKANFDGGWGGGWQDDWWAAIAGQTAWLTWEQYDAKDRELIRKMVEWEANRRMIYTVPYYRKKDGTIVTPGDTKAEENAWNTTVLFLACAMMPNHENYNKWYSKGIELAISAYAHPKDVESETVINGKPLKEWLNGSNTEENYMVINHNRLHPEYTCRTDLSLLNAAVLTLGGKPTPEGVFFNSDKAYRAVVETEFASPPFDPPGGTCYKPESAEVYFPQGSDWGTSRYFTFGPWDAINHAYGLDAGLVHNGAYWEKLHSGKVKELQDRFNDGHLFANAKESSEITEQIVAYEATLAIWAKWAVLQKDFKITKDAPKP